MGIRTRSPRAARLAIRFGSVWLLSLGLARGVSAGQPPALTDDSSRPSATSHAAADTSRKAVSKTATTAKKTATKPVATAKTATAKPAAAATTTTKEAVPPKTAAASKTPTVSSTAVTKHPVMATVAPAPTKSGSVAPHVAATAAKPATISKPGAASPTSVNPNVAMAKGTAPVTKPKVAPAPARVVPMQKNASLTPGLSRAPSAVGMPGGPKLAQTGGTVVRGPVSPDLTIGPPVPVNLGHPSGKAAPNAANVSATGRLKVTTPAPAKGGVSKTSTVATPAPLEEHVTYQYNALGRRDPFQSLIDGGWVGADVGGDAPPDVGGIKLVGIVWGTNDQFAMCEDVRGNSYVLRRGDRVMNGYVEGLKQDAMIVSITVDGQSESVTIPITRKGEKSNASR